MGACILLNSSFLQIYAQDLDFWIVMATLFLVFWGSSILFSIGTAPVHIPTNSVGVSLFSTLSSAFIVCRLFDDGHSDQHEVSHYGFDLHFSSNYQDFYFYLLSFMWDRKQVSMIHFWLAGLPVIATSALAKLCSKAVTSQNSGKGRE